MFLGLANLLQELRMFLASCRNARGIEKDSVESFVSSVETEADP